MSVMRFVQEINLAIQLTIHVTLVMPLAMDALDPQFTVRYVLQTTIERSLRQSVLKHVEVATMVTILPKPVLFVQRAVAYVLGRLRVGLNVHSVK